MSYPVMSVADFRSHYLSTHAPPAWNERSDALVQRHWNSVRVYYDRKDRISDVAQLVQARDPVNIALDKYGTRKPFAMKGAPPALSYSEQAKKLGSTALPPNIAIFCTTPIQLGKTFVNAHVINAVAFGFDHPDQPDARFFCESGTTCIAEHRTSEYEKHVRRVVRKIFACAKDQKFKRLMLSMIGCGCFAGDNKSAAERVLLKAFASGVRAWEATGRQLQIGMLGSEGQDPKVMMALDAACKKGTMCTVLKQTGSGPYRIPECMTSPELNDGKKTLYVNAWDPHSAVGNGNSADDSLDGYFGRASAMAALCHTFTNERLRELSRYHRV